MVNVFFATNRNPDNPDSPTEFGREFSAQGLTDLRFGFTDVDPGNPEQAELNVFPENLVSDRTGRHTDNSQSNFGSRALMESLRRKMDSKARDTVVLIHGYNVSFREALADAARVKQQFLGFRDGEAVNIVLFSWPSDGSMLPFVAYSNDRADARASSTAFARGFLKLNDFLGGLSPEDMCKRSIHLIAHSMGNYVLRNALQEILSMHAGRTPRLFDQIFLMAADEDDDAFEHPHKLLPLPQLARRVSVYFNNGDLAMGISDVTKGNPDRLGCDGPRLPSLVPARVSLIDCSEVVGGLVEHSYYKDSQEVVADMRGVLAGITPERMPRRTYIPDSNRYRIDR